MSTPLHVYLFSSCCQSGLLVIISSSKFGLYLPYSQLSVIPQPLLPDFYTDMYCMYSLYCTYFSFLQGYFLTRNFTLFKFHSLNLVFFIFDSLSPSPSLLPPLLRLSPPPPPLCLNHPTVNSFSLNLSFITNSSFYWHSSISLPQVHFLQIFLNPLKGQEREIFVP